MYTLNDHAFGVTYRSPTMEGLISSVGTVLGNEILAVDLRDLYEDTGSVEETNQRIQAKYEVEVLLDMSRHDL